ncbi:MAG: hypothetical protein H7Z39_07705 [Burkholderiaceae bacterium]|nr:hypothetical protein [Burkholderiaceae bacterium]
MLIPGSCRCGNISFVLRWEPAPTEIPARACSCSFCTTHGGVWTSCPSASLKVGVREPGLVSKHAFATRTAQFHICDQCGDVPVVTSRIDGRLYAVVNVAALEGVEPLVLRHAALDVDGESEPARIARRRQNWVADVEYVESAT